MCLQMTQKQEVIIKEKTEAVMADLAQVKPAVEDARQGMQRDALCRVIAKLLSGFN